jgi:hypothetical protein
MLGSQQVVPYDEISLGELVHEDAPHLGMEMLHLWYKSYSLHIIVLRGGTIQHGQSDQLCFYSETVGPDWSGHAHLQVRT